MELYEAIKKRRDIRSYYKDDEIPYNVLAKILFSGTSSTFSRFFSTVEFHNN